MACADDSVLRESELNSLQAQSCLQKAFIIKALHPNGRSKRPFFYA
jgi:hypothetical protein